MKKQSKKSRINNDIKKEHKEIKKNKHVILKSIAVVIIILVCIFVFETFKLKSLILDIKNFETSTVFDMDGNKIATLGNSKKREKVEFGKIPKNLINAYIAIEDKRFYDHNGVDIKRTGAAIVNYVTKKGSTAFGGSTITQQLVKNISGDDQSNVKRKVIEWFRAWQTETFMSKDEILEAYFNIIYTGPNIYGVNMGAKYYFNKELSNLDLAECAFLAGINNSPNSYNPFSGKDNGDKIKSRTKTVLNQMKEQGLISDEECNNSVNEVDIGLNFVKGQIADDNNEIYSYHTDALINELIDDVSKSKNISKSFALNYIEMSGFNIYSTQNSKLQNIIDTEMKKSKYVLNSKLNPGTTSQGAFVIIDHKTGQVLGCSGGIGEKTQSRAFNRATQSTRQTGSAGKPIAVLAPALSNKLITAASRYTDEATTFDDGEEGYSPTDYNGFKGNISVRDAVESSQNVPFVKIMEQLTPRESISFMRRMGITTLTSVDDNLNLALGGLDKGISPLEMAGAYATIANDGNYIEPTFYINIKDKNGKEVFKSKQAQRQVFSENVAYILKDLLKQPVEGNSGTAVYCRINGIDVAAKTGTTNENYDRWLCGFTNYYTGVAWFGFDKNERISYSGNNPAGTIWSGIMKTVHQGLGNSKFEVPNGVSALAVCKDTGMIATFNCKNTYTEYFTNDNIPKSCSVHGGL